LVFINIYDSYFYHPFPLSVSSFFYAYMRHVCRLCNTIAEDQKVILLDEIREESMVAL